MRNALLHPSPSPERDVSGPGDPSRGNLHLSGSDSSGLETRSGGGLGEHLRGRHPRVLAVGDVDLDGDGDTDVVGTLEGGQKVLWWRNDGGSPPILTEEVIDPALPGADGRYTGDFDLSDGLRVGFCP